MPKLAANLTMLFGESAFLDRFAAAAAQGFRGVESPLSLLTTTPPELARRLRDQGLVQVLHNLPAGNWSAGERGIACHPDRMDEFKNGVAQAVKYATALDCDRVNCLAGDPAARRRSGGRAETFVRNLSYAAPLLTGRRHHAADRADQHARRPGFFLSGAAGDRIMDAVGSDNLELQYDIYHMQIMEGDLANTIERLLPRIGHMQLADVPGAMNREPEASTIRHCSRPSIGSATTAGSAASTCRLPEQCRPDVGCT